MHFLCMCGICYSYIGGSVRFILWFYTKQKISSKMRIVLFFICWYLDLIDARNLNLMYINSAWECSSFLTFLVVFFICRDQSVFFEHVQSPSKSKIKWCKLIENFELHTKSSDQMFEMTWILQTLRAKPFDHFATCWMKPFWEHYSR